MTIGTFGGKPKSFDLIENTTYNETVGRVTTDSSAITLSASFYNSVVVEMTQNVTLGISTGADGERDGYAMSILIDQDDNNQYTISWDSDIKWSGGSAPSAPAAGNTLEVTIVSYDGAETWYGRTSWSS